MALVALSALVADGVQVFIDPKGPGPTAAEGRKVQASLPRALDTKELEQFVHQFAVAAKHAMAAGFDGFELHGANGHLINQFIDSGTNLRADQHGGSLGNRLRFLKEVTHPVAAIVCPDCVGVRLPPLTIPTAGVKPQRSPLLRRRFVAVSRMPQSVQYRAVQAFDRTDHYGKGRAMLMYKICQARFPISSSDGKIYRFRMNLEWLPI